LRRRYLGVHFVKCRVYSRLYRNPEGTAYVGCCPRCGAYVRIPIGEGGTSQRFFRAVCPRWHSRQTKWFQWNGPVHAPCVSADPIRDHRMARTQRGKQVCELHERSCEARPAASPAGAPALLRL